MVGFLRRLFASRQQVPAPPAHVEVPAVRQDAMPETPQARVVAGKLVIPSAAGSIYEYELTKPFWAAVARMLPGAFVKYESAAGEWHVFVVEEGPLYGRAEHAVGGPSVVVRRVSTGARFTMPVDRLSPCEPAFRGRDGTTIRRGEGLRGR